MKRDKALQTRVTEKEFNRVTKLAKSSFGSVDNFIQFLIKNYKTPGQVTFALLDTVLVNGKKYSVVTCGKFPVFGKPTIKLTPHENNIGGTIEIEIIEPSAIQIKKECLK